MALETILLFALKSGVPLVVRAAGKQVLKRIAPTIERARKSAVKRTAKDLGEKFPSVNFLEYNFQFNSPTAKNELEKLISEAELPDESALKKEMAIEMATRWPEYSDHAEEIVDVFLKHFEEECLKIEELQPFTLISIIRKGNTATQQLVREYGESSQEGLRLINEKLQSIESVLMPLKVTNQEPAITRITSLIERRLVKERDELLGKTKKWNSKGLYDKTETLAKEALELRHDISSEIAGSIFRLTGSYSLRSFRDKEKAEYWIKLAEEAEPSNHKTIALKAELLCFENRWEKAYQILNPIAEKTTEPIVKIIHCECLSHLSGVKAAFEWLVSQEDVKDDYEIKLNLASLAVRDSNFNYALPILNALTDKPFPGPYPYLLKAEILVNQAMPQEAVVITTAEDLELRKEPKQIMLAIENLEKGIALLETAARSLEIPPHVNVLCELYIAIGDIKSAEKSLCNNWRILRKNNNAWFIASSIVFLRGKRGKVLVRAQKALKVSKENDQEAMFRFGLLCMNIEEWDKCLDAINSIPLESLDSEHLKGMLQMKVLCYHRKGVPELVDQNLQALKDKFPSDETWVVLQGLMYRQTGNLDQAMDLLARELTNFPDSVKIKIQLAFLFREQKRYGDALPLYRELTRVLKSTKAYEETCIVGFYAQIPEEVILLTIEAEKRGMTSDTLTHFKAIALSMNKQYNEAYELFSHFAEDSLTSNDYLFYSFCTAHKVNAPEAINLLNKAKIKYPKDTRVIRELCSLFLEINAVDKAFQEAKLWLGLDKSDKGAHFAVILTGFAAGEQEFAHKTLMDYVAIFGEGPELRSGTIEDVKKHLKVISERSELLWEKYQAGQLPEVILGADSNLGLGGYRIALLKSPGRVMAFNGNPDFQRKHFVDTLTAREVLIDYHGLITMYFLNLIGPTMILFDHMNIPEVVLDKIREDLAELSLSYQKDKRKIKEEAFLKIKSMFQIYDKFPQTNFKAVPEVLGNSIYDLLICKEKNCLYVTPGFEQQESETIKRSLQVDSISVVDVVNLMKEEGIISGKQHQKVMDTLGKYKLKSLFKPERAPDRATFDWNALEMLEECSVLLEVPRLFKESSVGPFTYALLNSEIERYKRIDQMQKDLRNIEGMVRALSNKGVCKLIPTPRGVKDNNKKKVPKHIRGLEYLEDLKNICLGNDFVLWTDDLGLCNLSASNGIKTTCTRTILDVLLKKIIIKDDEHVETIIQLLKWGMYFCWINADAIIKCSEMYGYSKSDDVTLIFGALTNEIQGYLNHVPTDVEISNFNVASESIRRLWLLPGRAQSLAMELFDTVLSAIDKKDILRKYWIVISILSIAGIGEIPLADFLRNLSLRMPGQINDELRMSLRLLIELCLKKRDTDVIRISGKRIRVAAVIKAVKQAIPGYRDEFKRLVLQLDPVMETII